MKKVMSNYFQSGKHTQRIAGIQMATESRKKSTKRRKQKYRVIDTMAAVAFCGVPCAVYEGTLEQCERWIAKQPISWSYKIEVK